jgi:hypothetical protein
VEDKKMRESIPVGGWRESEQRTVEVFAGKAKARDVVPGWPRGRSTSRAYVAGSVWPWVYVHELIGGTFLGVFPRMELEGLSRKPYVKPQPPAEEAAAEQAEERRKADMMEGWYESKRLDAQHMLILKGSL